MLLFKQVLVGRPRLDHRATCRTSLKVVSSAAVSCADFSRLAICLAQTRHLDALFLTAGPAEVAAGAATLAAGRCGWAASPLTLGSRKHIFLGQAAILAAALDLGWINAEFEHQAAYGRRQRQVGNLSRLRRQRAGAGAATARQPALVSPRRIRNIACSGSEAESPIIAMTAPTFTVAPSFTSIGRS